MKFTVEIPEVHVVTVEIELPDDCSLKEIKKLAGRVTESNYLNTEYSHTLPEEQYVVRDCQGKCLGEQK